MVGEIKMFIGEKAPDGWAICDGTILPVPSFGALFALVGNAYGGDGQNDFALPDFRGRVPIGVSKDVTGISDSVLGDKGGAEAVTLTTTQMPDHSHDVNALSTAGNNQSPTGRVLADAGSFDTEFSDQTPDTVMSADMIGSTGGGQPVDIRQPFLCVNYIIALYGCAK